jgi:hypothetical protein
MKLILAKAMPREEKVILKLAKEVDCLNECLKTIFIPN